MSFPLLKLPYVALNHILKVMDPLEQLQICETSRKLKFFVKRPTRNCVMELEINLPTKLKSIILKSSEKVSKIQVRLVKKYRKNYEKNRIYYLNGTPILYILDTEKDDCISFMNQLLIGHFDPHTIFYNGDITNAVIDEWNFKIFNILENGSQHFVVSKCNSTFDFKRVLQKVNIVAEQSLGSGVRIQDSTWMTSDDLHIVLNVFQVIKLKNAPISDLDLNQMLKNWKNGLVDIRRVHLKSENDQFNFPIIIDGLDAVEIDAADVEIAEISDIVLSFYYRVDVENGIKGVVCGNGKMFVMSEHGFLEEE